LVAVTEEKNMTIMYSSSGYAEVCIAAFTFTENPLDILRGKQHHLVHIII